MSRLSKALIFAASISLLTMAVFPAAAKLQEIAPEDAQKLGLPPGNDLKAIIIRVINVGLTLVALAAGLYIIIAGVRYIISQGEEEDTKKAKRSILYAVIGLLVIGIAAVLVNFVIVNVIGPA